MKHFPRLVSKANSAKVLSSAAALGSVTILIGSVAFAQRAYAVQLLGVMPENSVFMVHSSQGYLGIEMRDIDSDRAAALKLKDPAGAEIVVVDHDAPAGKVGLRVHDVILQMNGQPVQGIEQLRRMLRETPPGRNVSLLISRDGQQQTVNVQLADRAKIEQDAWTQIQTIHDPDDDSSFALVAPSGHGPGSGFFGALTFGSPSLGVELDPLGSQLADYFGIKDGQGLLVKRVAQNSPASTAGLKAGDVITKVNGEATPTLNSWAKSIHANRGKQVQVTIVRNHKEQTVNLQAGDAKHKGELVIPEFDWYNDRSKLEENLPQFEARLRETINPALLAEETRQAISGIDAEALAEQARQTVKSLNLPELQKQMQIDQRQVEREMKNLQKDLESLRFDDLN